MKNIIKKHGRQGDLAVRMVDSIPKGLKVLPIDKIAGGYTLALGEHSNHRHTLIPLEGASVQAWKADNGSHYFTVKGGNAKLLHGTFIAPGKINEEELDKHLEIILYPGKYRQDVKIEYSPFDQLLQRVQD